MTQVTSIPREVERAHRQCSNRWIGCDWPTKFGNTGLNLRNLKASHALLMARATSGDEKADWHAAAEWLTLIERQACDAEFQALLAMTRFREGRTKEAVQHARRACEIEKKSHPDPIWKAFKEAIERLAAETVVGS